MTGMMLGVPSLALSQVYTPGKPMSWDASRKLGAGVVRKLLEIGWGRESCLNINFPPLPAEECGPITLARQGAGWIDGMRVETRTDLRGGNYHWIGFRRGDREQGPEADTVALRAGRIVVTPIKYDRTDEEAYAGLKAHLPRL